MIIGVLTAFTAIKIVWETLEILHMVHVGHMTGKASYKGGNFIKNAIQQRQKEWQYQKNPAQQLEQEAKTPYDFQAAKDAAQAIQNIKEEAEAYLAKLKESVGDLGKALDCFSKIYTNLTELVRALDTEDEHQFSVSLLLFNNNFASFQVNLSQYLLSIEPPPRERLYIADLFSREKGIAQYNNHLNSIKEYIRQLQITEEKIAAEFKRGFDTILTLLPAMSSRAARSFERLQQEINSCMHDPKRIAETMQRILPKHKKLAGRCAGILRIFAQFKQSHKTERTDLTEQISLLEENPNWFPLLTEVEQIEVGQRIFLHAMNEPYIEEKNYCSLKFSYVNRFPNT